MNSRNPLYNAPAKKVSNWRRKPVKACSAETTLADRVKCPGRETAPLQMPQAQRPGTEDTRFATPAAPYRSLPGPEGPESRKSLQRVSRGRNKKCPKQSKNSLRSLETAYCETPETVFRLFRTLFGPRGPEDPERLFGDSFVWCVIAQAFCSQKSFREITLNYAKLR